MSRNIGGCDNITAIINRNSDQPVKMTNHAMQRIYQKIREIAFFNLQNDGMKHTYCVTSLAGEAFLRLHETGDVQWESRRQYFAAVSVAVKRILVEKARHYSHKGRSCAKESMEFQDELYMDKSTVKSIMDINEALEKLEKKDKELAELVRFKFFVGLSNQEIADLLGASLRKVERRWSFAKAWITKEMTM